MEKKGEGENVTQQESPEEMARRYGLDLYRRQKSHGFGALDLQGMIYSCPREYRTDVWNGYLDGVSADYRALSVQGLTQS